MTAQWRIAKIRPLNDSAVKVLGEPTLIKIARELVETVRKNVTIDWTVRENVRAQLRVIVKRILRKYGYPPDKQEKPHKRCLSRQRYSAQSGLWRRSLLAAGNTKGGGQQQPHP